MSAHKANTQRIAKNMLALYFRMFFQMGVSLYSSRILLAQLGQVDFGIYDVVAGFVLVLSFLNNTMTSSTQRFVTYALGTGQNAMVSRVFSISLSLHFFLALAVLLLGETVGLWYIYHQLQVPPDRLEASLWVFQAALFATCMLICSVPHNAIIIAYERMTAFAYISIVDVSLKLGIVLSLPYWRGDSLKVYAGLLVLETLLIRLVQAFYCKYRIPTAQFSIIRKDSLYKELLVFAGWSSFGNFAYVANTQGTNLLLNLLGGPILGPVYNASRAVAFQVQTAINAFVAAFLTSINPQIIKSYAQGDLATTHHLVLLSSRIAFCLIFVFVFPLLIETTFFLQLWLKEIPVYAVAFTRLLILVICVEAISNALCIAADATGRVKRFNIVTSMFSCATLPLGYVLYQLCHQITMVYVALLICSCVTLGIRFYLGRALYGLPLRHYFKEVFCRIFFVLCFACSLPLLLKVFLSTSPWHSLLLAVFSLIWVALGVWLIGLCENEKVFIQNRVKTFIWQKK